MACTTFGATSDTASTTDQDTTIASPTTTAAPPDPGVVWRERPRAYPTPAGWTHVEGILDDGVSAAMHGYGVNLTWCAVPLDFGTAAPLCAGSNSITYSASLPKVAMGVAAVEAFAGDLDHVVSDYTAYAAHAAALQVSIDSELGNDTPAEVVSRAENAAERQTPTTVGDLVYAMIKFSDNEAYNRLVDLIAKQPVTETGTTFQYVNSLTARVDPQLAEDFHIGNYMNKVVGGDWNHLTAAGASRYLAAVVAAADGDVPASQLDTVRPGQLTTPRAARTVLEAMYDQTRTTKIPADLPESTVANKTGETSTVSHDMAVIGTQSGRIVLVAVSSRSAAAYPPDAEMGTTARDVVSALGGPQRL